MKELTKKILEGGLIDKTTAALLARWGMLKPEELSKLQHKQVVCETLEIFIEQLEELLDKEPSTETTDKPMRETRLDFYVTPVEGWYCPSTGAFSAVRDQMGNIMVPPHYAFQPGDKIWKAETPFSKPPDYTVEKVDPLYRDDKVVVIQLTVS